MKWVITAAVIVSLAGLTFAKVGEELPRSVMAGGGAGIGGTVHRLAWTSGQPVVGVSAGATHVVQHGFWHAQSTVTAAEDEPIPPRFALHQNVPNPFNPSTEIRFDLPVPQDDVAIRIYDVSGRMVRVLRGTGLSAGSHTITWNGTDEAGHTVASGVYYYALEIPQARATHRMTLVR